MFGTLKLMKLASGLRGRDGQAAYSSVLELGRVGSPRAVELLMEALSRRDGVARCAARELGRLQAARAVQPLVEMLSHAEVSQAAAEALGKLGRPAGDALLSGLRAAEPQTRRVCAEVLGQLGDSRAVEGLAQLVQGDPDYEVRVAAATSIGLLKDARAVWALVGVLKLRDEPGAERQAGLERLRQAANLAMRRIGDPLAKRKTSPQAESPTEAEPVAQPAQSGHPALMGDTSQLALEELVGVMQELVQASEEISWAKLEQRDPLVAPHFASYELRRQAAESVGQELHRRGGKAMTARVLKTRLNNHATTRNWWEDYL